MHHITTFFMLLVSTPDIILFEIAESLENKTSIQCRINMTSTCANYKITKWNKKDVGRHLKNWIKSILIEWKGKEQSIVGSHCKAFIVKRNTFFNQYAPDAVSPNVIILAKIKQQNDAKTTNDNGVVGKPAVGWGLVGLMERGKSGWGGDGSIVMHRLNPI